MVNGNLNEKLNCNMFEKLGMVVIATRGNGGRSFNDTSL